MYPAKIALYSVLSTILLLIPSCKDGPQSMLYTFADESKSVSNFWFLLVGVSLFVFISVTFFLIAAVVRKQKEEADIKDRKLVKAISLATVLSAIILVATIIFSYELPQPKIVKAGPAMTIEITGKLWWWDIKYYTENGEFLFTTANEIKLPVREDIRLKLISDNVIHSLWIPKLAGKMDLIPGRTNYLWINAKKIAKFQGQCAEFCGVQHANMFLVVETLDKKDFNKWINSQKKEAIGNSKHTGLKVFKEVGCVRCHEVRGHVKRGDGDGPDLTHFASRQTIASGTVANNLGNLMGWISDPHGIKPGNLMPATALTSEDLKDVTSYLRSLK